MEGKAKSWSKRGASLQVHFLYELDLTQILRHPHSVLYLYFCNHLSILLTTIFTSSFLISSPSCKLHPYLSQSSAMNTPDDYRRFMTAPPPEPTPPSFNPGVTATGIPVSSPEPSFGDKPSQAPLQPKVKPPREPWSSGLCDCFSDPRNCTFLPCPPFSPP